MNIEIKIKDLIEFSETKKGRHISAVASRLDFGDTNSNLGVNGWPFKANQGRAILEAYLMINMDLLGINSWSTVNASDIQMIGDSLILKLN